MEIGNKFLHLGDGEIIGVKSKVLVSVHITEDGGNIQIRFNKIGKQQSATIGMDRNID